MNPADVGQGLGQSFGFGDLGSAMSTLIISGLGAAIFLYGKKQASLKPLVAGLVLSALPFFVTSLLVLWLSTGACLGGLYASTRGD